MPEKIIVAIDGPSGSGKSTTAKIAARKLGYKYLDSGAMYRATTLFINRNGISIKDLGQLEVAFERISIEFELNQAGENRTFLNGEDVEQEIRSPEISSQVSAVSAIQEVRWFLIKQQREIGKGKGIVMDGRDIGTYVFPNAELKIFMVSDPKVRALRRFEEMKRKGIQISKEEVLENLLERDRIDSERAANPLRKADDAIELDNSNMSIQDQVNFVLDRAKRIIG